MNTYDILYIDNKYNVIWEDFYPLLVIVTYFLGIRDQIQGLTHAN